MHPVSKADREKMMRVRLLLMTLPAPPPWVMLVSLLVSLPVSLILPHPARTEGSEPMPPTQLSAPTADSFGKLPDGTEAMLYTLQVPGGWRATITNYGGIVTSFFVPQPNGPPIDIVLGFDSLEGYLDEHPFFGAICGRFGNRIADGQFTLDGKTATLAKNNGANHLHGGVRGFDKRCWQATPLLSDKGPALDLELISPAGDEGYPGQLTARVRYTLTPAGEFWVEMEAQTDAPTVVNLVHHSYWNLAGHDAGGIGNHQLTAHANCYLPLDAGGIPTGQLAPVSNTPFDFRPTRPEQVALRDAIAGLTPSPEGAPQGGIDHCLVLDNWQPDGSLHPAVTLIEPVSGRSLEILTDQPGIQIYTANYLDGSVTGKDGAAYRQHGAICLETECFPDAINHALWHGDWPSGRLDPGQTYRHVMVHRFGTGQ